MRESPGRTDEGLLGIVAHRPPWRRGALAVVIGTMVALVGLVDYATGTEISVRAFYLVPIALATAWFGWRTGTIASVACVTVWLASDFLAGGVVAQRPAVWWNAGVVFCFFITVVWTMHALVETYRRLEERVRERTAALEESLAVSERLQREMNEVVARAHNAIGHELHDGLGQHLTGTAMAAQVLAERLAGENHRAAGDARRIVQLVQDGIQQTRQLSRGLLMDAIEPQRLGAELEELAAATARASGVECRWSGGSPGPIDAATSAQLFRIAQEAVRNAVKHAGAGRIEIALNGGPDGLRLEIRDNGRGIPSEAERRGMGLRIMAHRAAQVGGIFSVESLGEGGTVVRCRIPAPSPRSG